MQWPPTHTPLAPPHVLPFFLAAAASPLVCRASSTSTLLLYKQQIEKLLARQKNERRKAELSLSLYTDN